MYDSDICCTHLTKKRAAEYFFSNPFLFRFLCRHLHQKQAAPKFYILEQLVVCHCMDYFNLNTATIFSNVSAWLDISSDAAAASSDVAELLCTT